MTRFAPLPALALALGLSTGAFAAEPIARTDVIEAAIDVFAVAMDANHDGRISPVEIDTAGQMVFAAMDRNGDSAVTLPEMLEWEDGFAEVAAFRGRTQAFDASMSLVFAMFDADGSRSLDAEEHGQAVATGWARADRDRDGSLTIDEFRKNFVMTVAVRTALNGPR